MMSALFSRSSHHYAASKVAVLGAAGGIGQPLSMLLKELPSIKHLALYDIANIGCAADLSHISTPTKVSGYSGQEQLHACLEGSEIVVIPAGVPRKPGMTRDDLFNINASIVKNLVSACAKACPKAHLLIISNPVNSTVPIAVETLKALGIAKPSVFGVTTLDIVRAKTFIGEAKGVDPTTVQVDVLGGHSGTTIVPLLNKFSFPAEQVKALTHRIQFGGDEVVKAKAGGGSATLSMAFAAREFVKDFIRALGGEKVVQTAFVADPVWKETGYFAGPLELGKSGLVKVLPLPAMNDYEKTLYNEAVPQLQKDIAKGVEFAKQPAKL